MLSRLARIGSDVVARVTDPDALPLVYFATVPNVGDLLNPYMLHKMTGRKIVRAQSDIRNHIRAVGSVLGSASPRSFIWGSGSIDGKPPRKAVDPTRIFALRGEGTLALCRERFGLQKAVPLGYPAILMPLLYDPAVESRHRVGLVPHFLDFDFVSGIANGLDGVTVLDVRQEVELFVDNLKQCQFVMSSSLHGLILADSYGVPNSWVKFTSDLTGDRWKFEDYFSTTDSKDNPRITITDRDSLQKTTDRLMIDAIVRAPTSDSTELRGALDELLRAFRNDRVRAA